MLEAWLDEKSATVALLVLMVMLGVWLVNGGMATLGLKASEWAESCGYVGRERKKPATPECGKVLDGALLFVAVGQTAPDSVGLERAWERCAKGRTREQVIEDLARSVAGDPAVAREMTANMYLRMELQNRYGCEG